MYTQEMLIGIGIGCVVGGIILGLIGGRFFLRSKHAAQLERELSEAQEAMKEYKNEVFQQFGDTARKFEKLNESYSDLHQQLATSATVLLADMPNVPLIASSTVSTLPVDEKTVETPLEDEATTADGQEAVQETKVQEAQVPEAKAQETTLNEDTAETVESAELVEPSTPTGADKPATP